MMTPQEKWLLDVAFDRYDKAVAILERTHDALKAEHAERCMWQAFSLAALWMTVVVYLVS